VVNFLGFNAANTAAEARTLSLNGDVSVALNSTSANRLQQAIFNNDVNFDFGGATRTFTINPASTGPSSEHDQLQILGQLRNGTGLVKNGFGFLILGTPTLSNPSPLTGTLRINAGVVGLQNNTTLSGISSIELAASANSANSYGRLELNANLGGSNPQFIPTSASVAASGKNQIVFIGQNNVNSSNSVGAVTLHSGETVLGAARNGTGNATLTVSSVTRGNTNNLLLVGGGTSLGGVNKVIVTSDSNITSSLVGGGGGAGSQNISIVPWARATGTQGGGDSSIFGGLNGFVTYDSTNGFRVLNTGTEYATLPTSGASTNNALISADTTLTGNTTINSLLNTAATNRSLLLGGNTLTVTSGAFAQTTTNAVLTINTGSITTGNSNPFSFTGRGGAYTVHARLTGSSDLIVGTVANVNALQLTNTSNDYSGKTVILGNLSTGVNASTVIPDTSDVVLGSGVLTIGGGSQESIKSLSGFGTVDFSTTTSRMNVGIGATLTTNGQVKVVNGGVVTPGDSTGFNTVGTLILGANVTSLLVDDASTALNFQLGSLSSFDTISLTTAGSAITINGGTLNLSLINGYTPTVGSTFNIITGQTGAGGTGFDAVNVIGSPGYTAIANAVGSNWQVQFTAVPEPSAIALLTAGLVAIVVFRRRSHRA